MDFEFVVNNKIDLAFFENTLKSDEEIQMVNPSAKLPFDKAHWLNFFERGNPTTSYLLKYQGRTVGHTALQLKKEYNSLWLCWVLVAKDFRGTDCALKLLRHTEEHVKSDFQLEEYYLNVLVNNKRAISFYEKNGFVKILEDERIIQMRKILS